MEFGEKWTLNNVSGNPFLLWNSEGLRFRTEYDAGRRPCGFHVQELAGSPEEVLVQKTEYGESVANAAAHNLGTKVYKVFDQAGHLILRDYDFNGNLLSSTRTLAQNYKGVLDWSKEVPLDVSATYSSSTTYDALNQPVVLVSPDNSQTYRAYNEGGYMDKIFVNIHGEQSSADLSHGSRL